MLSDEEDWEEQTFYERVGGRPAFEKLMSEFFRRVAADELLMTIYDPNDLAGAEARLLLFFEQYWGGPMTYSLTRGAPALKMRHMPYKVNNASKAAWLQAMHEAISTLEMSLEDEFLMRDYIERAAKYLINADDV